MGPAAAHDHRQSRQRCEACGRPASPPERRWLEAHERWEYDDAGRVQALRRLVCLCTGCHQATHDGLAGLRGLAGEARRHLCAVTGMTDQAARRHIDAARDLWARRSGVDWQLDLGILTAAGISLADPPDAARRALIAERELRGSGALD